MPPSPWPPGQSCSHLTLQESPKGALIPDEVGWVGAARTTHTGEGRKSFRLPPEGGAPSEDQSFASTVPPWTCTGRARLVTSS